jgi:hypothetical protein
MRRHSVPIFIGVFAIILCSPRLVLAQWPDWFQFGTEGSYVHQTAHLLFGGAMLFFVLEIYQAGLVQFRGFRCLVWAWALWALWNLDAFIGHWADWTLENPVILGEGFSRKLLMYDFHTWLVYITKIDHFLFLVPAFYLFYRGLKALAQNSGAEHR